MLFYIIIFPNSHYLGLICSYDNMLLFLPIPVFILSQPMRTTTNFLKFLFIRRTIPCCKYKQFATFHIPYFLHRFLHLKGNMTDNHNRIVPWHMWKNPLTHLPLDKRDAVSQTIFSNAFSWMESFISWLKFHWNWFLMVKLTITQHWIR